MKLDGCRRFETRGHEDTESLDKVRAATTIVISTWCPATCWVGTVDAVHVGAENGDSSAGFSRELGDDGALDPRMREEGDGSSASGILSGDLLRKVTS